MQKGREDVTWAKGTRTLAPLKTCTGITADNQEVEKETSCELALIEGIEEDEIEAEDCGTSSMTSILFGATGFSSEAAIPQQSSFKSG